MRQWSTVSICSDLPTNDGWIELGRTKCRGVHDLTIDASIESDASVHLSVLPALTGLTRKFGL